MDIVERLIAFKDHTGLTNSQFADKAGIPRPTLSQFLNGRNKRLSDDFTAKLHSAYPNLNVLWLLFGEGEMVTDENIEISEGKNVENYSLFNDEPIVNKEDNTAEQAERFSAKNDSNKIFEPEQQEFDRRDHSKVLNDHNVHPFQGTTPQTPHPVIPTDPAKKIQSIMVFYSDNSYEIFTPTASGNKKA